MVLTFHVLCLQTLHSICRIAEVLLTLQQVGNVNYTGWVLQVRCLNNRQLIDELQLQAKVMEDELWKWKLEVRSKRESFYELNYYTTLQLLTIRRELGKLKKPEIAPSIPPDVLALLHSISTHVDSSHVINIVSQVLLEAKSTQPAPVVELPQTQSSPEAQEQTSDTASADLSEEEEVHEPIVTEHRSQLREDDLTEEQKADLATICRRLDFPKQLVLKAFEECTGENITRIDYERWCAENIDNYDFLDDTGASSDDDSSGSESDSERADASTDDDDEGFNYMLGTYVV